jgi:hypothetical protein
MMVTIKCPKCGTEGKMSLVDPDFTGAYKCWSCRAYFTLKLRGNVVESLDPLSDADYEAKYAKKTEPFPNIRIGGPPRPNSRF